MTTCRKQNADWATTNGTACIVDRCFDCDVSDDDNEDDDSFTLSLYISMLRHSFRRMQMKMM